MRRRFFLLLVILAALVLPRPAAACEPYPIPYFLEQITFVRAGLPAGIGVRAIPDTNSAQSSWVALAFVNHTDQPVFLLGGQHREAFTPDLKPTDITQMAQALKEYTLPPNAVDEPIKLNLEALPRLDTTFEQRNSINTSRPDNVKIPEPQALTLLLITNGKVYELPVTVAYTLNPDYRPQPCPTDDLFVSTPKTESGNAQFVGLVLGLLFGGGGLIWFWVKRRKKEVQ
ncbi:MAG: hypothetical protein H6636_00780 [Anaerolineales bacterium]|nr:hypothetical protein [Anaerolineales bacterium]